MENIGKRYVYIGNNIDLPDVRLNKGSIYFGDKIEEIIKKYSLLDKLLIEINDLPNAEKNEAVIEYLTEELKENVKGEENGI